jgi:hypothetical protein
VCFIEVSSPKSHLVFQFFVVMPFPSNIKSPGVGHGQILDKERVNATFHTEELSQILYGGPHKLAERRKLQALVHHDPVFSKRDKFFLSRDELYVRGLKATQKLLEIAVKHDLSEEQFETVYVEMGMVRVELCRERFCLRLG